MQGEKSIIVNRLELSQTINIAPQEYQALNLEKNLTLFYDDSYTTKLHVARWMVSSITNDFSVDVQE